MPPKQYFVYILLEVSNDILRTGITSDLPMRTYELASEREYLVYLETVLGPASALAREFELRNLDQSKRHELVESENPGWHDLGSKFS